MRGKTLPFRLYAQILIFSALVALGVLILWSLQQALYGGIVSIRDGLINRLEQQINRKIQYSSISPSILGSFDVRNVRIVDTDGNSVFTISRFRVTYSLLNFLRTGAHAIRSIRIDSPLIDFDMVRDRDLIALFEDFYNKEASPVLPDKLMVRVRNGNCQIYNGNDQFGFDTLNLNIEIADERVDFTGRWITGVAIDMIIGTPVRFQTAMRADGFYRTDLKEGDAVFTIPSITGDANSAMPISFGMALKDEVFRLGKMPSQLPLDFSFEYMMNDGTIDSYLNCADFSLGEFLSFSDEFEGIHQFLDIAASGTAFLQRNYDGSLSYSVDLTGRHPMGIPGASFEVNAAGDEHRVAIHTLRLSLPEDTAQALFFGNVGFSGSIDLAPFAPEGILSLDNFSLSGNENINAYITLTASHDVNAMWREIQVFCETLHIAQIELMSFDMLLRPSETNLDFTVSARRYANFEDSFSLKGFFNFESRRMEANLSLDTFSTGDIFAITMPFVKSASLSPLFIGLLDNISATTEVFFATDFKQVEYNAPSLVLHSNAGKGFTGYASISGNDRYFALDDGRLVQGDEVFFVSGQGGLTGFGDISFSINAGYRELEYFIEGGIDNNSVNIFGPYGLDISLTNVRGGGYFGFVQADDFPLPFLGHGEDLALFSLAAQFRYSSSASWLLNLEQCEVRNIASPAGPAQLWISGAVDHNGATIPSLYYRDSLGPIDGTVETTWTSDFTGISGLAVLGGANEHYRIEGSFADRNLDFAILGKSMRLDRFFGLSGNTLADGDIYVSWDLSDSFRAELNLSSLSGRMRNQEFSVSARAVLDNEALVVNGLRLNVAEFEGTVPSLTVNRVTGIAEASAGLNGSIGEKEIKSDLVFEAGFETVRSWFEIEKLLSSFSGSVHFKDFVFNRGQSQSFSFIFSRTTGDSDGSFSVTGGPRDMLRLNMDNDGNFFVGLSSPFPVRGSVIGSIKNSVIDAYSGDLYVDLSELFNMMPKTTDLFITGGYVNASLGIQGSITDPEFYGTARATSLRIKIPNYIPQELRPIPFNVAIDGNEAYFGPVSTSVGNGAGTVGGWFRFDRWIPNIFSLDVLVPRETAIPYDFEVTGFVARGDIHGSLNITMDDLILGFSGDLVVNRTELGVNAEGMSQTDEAFSKSDTPFTVDVTVTTGPSVEFLYPSSSFPILRANADNGTKVHVTVDSLAKQFSINSDIRVRSGEIYYFERSFYIRSGTLVFRENELRFTPRLTARAEVREHTADGPVTISMIVDNAPLLSFTARFESSPSLSQMEIFSILGMNTQGIQYDEDPESIQRAFLNSSSDLLAQFVVVRQLEQQLRHFMRLDMFSVRTQALQNYIFTQTGLLQSPVDRSFTVGNYFDNTTVFGGKYIGQDMFVQGMLSMRYDANNTSFGGLTLRPDIGVELQNPLFSIRWDFSPTHPENWYINDNSITLTKSWSF